METKKREDWERTRIQTFLLLSPNFSKKNQMTFQKFCKQIFTLPWDSENKPTEIIPVDPNDWYELLSKPKKTQSISDPNMLSEINK